MTQRTEIALKLMQQKCAKMNATELCRVSRPSGSKDRHSKVLTSKGPRDRRIRLSLETAVKFYEVQDRLGYDQPNKAIEWLIHKSQSAIDDLPQIPTTGFQISQFLYSNYLEHLSSFQSENGEAAEWNPFFANGNILSNSEKVNKGDLYSTGLSTETSAAQEFSPETTTREFSNKDTNKRSGSPIENSLWMEQQTLCSPCLSIRRKEEKLLSSRDRRAKARERARERTEATHSSKIGRKIYSHAGQLSVETERQNPTHRLCMQENMSSLKESVGENGNPLSTHPHAHAVSAKFSPAVEKLTHSQLLSRPQSSHRDFPEDSVNLGRSRSNLVFNGCLGEMEGSLQKSRQTNLQYCPPQHKGIRSIQSTETLNSTVFPISSLSSDSPFPNVVPSSQANLLTASSSCSPDCAYSQSLNFESSLQISISKLSSSSAAAECLNGSQFCYNQLRKVQELEAIQENPELQNACAEKLFSKTLSNISSLCSTLSSATRRSHTSCDSLMSSPSPVDANYYARELSFNNEDYSFENDMTNIPARIQGFEQFYDEIGDSYGVLQN